MGKMVRMVVFTLIGIAIFLSAQEILTPDWSDVNANVGHTVAGIHEIEDDSIDVLFLGPSFVHLGVSPMKLYMDTGVCSYNLATPGQPIASSYCLLQEAFECQNPSVVVFDASQLFYRDIREKKDANWRYVLDNIGLSIRKLDLAREYANVIDDADVLSALFPLFRFHSRWSELTEADFEKGTDESYYSAGQFIISSVYPATATLESSETQLNYLLEMTSGSKKYIENGKEGEIEIDMPAYSPQVISEYCLNYLLKIKQLCESRGAQLLLITVPTRGIPQSDAHIWTKQMYTETKSLSEELQVPFYDLTFDTETDVDFAEDTIDSGTHLNIRGAEKVTIAIEKYLIGHYSLITESHEEYDKNLIAYTKIRDIAFLQSEFQLSSYMERLIQNKNQWTIFISASDEYTSGMDAQSYSQFEELGLELIADGKYADSYVAVIENGANKYEAISDRRIDYDASLENCSVELSSSGWWTVPYSSIVIDDQEYSLNKRGLNFVIYDNESGLVVDSVTFDTYQEGKPAERDDTLTLDLLRAYEAAICFN